MCIVCSSALRISLYAASCCCPHPAASSLILLAASMFLRLHDFIALVRKSVSVASASENKGMSSRIHPAAAWNCHTSPTVCGGGMLRSPATRSGSTVIPCRVTCRPQYMVSSTNRSHLAGCIAILCADTVCRNSSSISSISASLAASSCPTVVYSKTSSVCMIRPLPISGRPSRRFTLANMCDTMR